MAYNRSTTFMFSGENAIEKAKTIRGSQRTKDDDEPLGIRGRYCYIANANEDDIRKLKANCHPNRNQLIDAIIGGVIHASDTIEEIVIISKIFKIHLEK